MTEIDMHCNVLKCRKPLLTETQVCVTSCSHIFCLDCSNKLFSEALVCPACNTGLPENGDIILSQLNPTEQYKSSVLAGLKPEIVLDISSRAIAFYEYQISQELCLKSMLQSNMENKYNTLKKQFNLMSRDLNHAIKIEKEKQAGLLREKEVEKKRGQQLGSQLEEKTKQFQKLQSMYEKLKRKAIVPNIQQQQLHNPTITASSVITSASRMRAPCILDIKQINDNVSRVGQSNAPKAFMTRPPETTRESISRIPSPTGSVYSVRSSRYMSRNETKTQPDAATKEGSGTERHYHHHKRHRHRANNM